MKIEVGKRYKTQCGEEASIDCCLPRSPYSGSEYAYPFCGWVKGRCLPLSWNEGGVSNCTANRGHDLIAEWREPVTKEVTVYLRQDKGNRETWTAIDCVECGNFKTIGSAKVTLTEGEFA